MSLTDAFRILDAAWAHGVRAFDTAEAYGDAAARLKAWIDARRYADSVEVVTKCRADFAGEPMQTLEASADAALARFEGIGRVVLLTHGAVDAMHWPAVIAVSTKHRAKPGQSVYTPIEVKAACSLPGIERLQVPGNVLDQRAILARGSAAVSLDVRSVYLQGVLLDNPETADVRAPGAGSISVRLRTAAASLGSSLPALLVASVLRMIGPGDRVVIGVDDASELEPLREAFELPGNTVGQFQQALSTLAADPATARILDPRQWPQAVQ
jgi:aryl-alcohol dehydrogenase-like predicted oxidoreductase